MVEQTIESKFGEYGQVNTGKNVSVQDKQVQVSVKKTVLKDVQDENKDRESSKDPIKVSGSKRLLPECPMTSSPSQQQSANSNMTSGPLVYVRRKSEAELGKTSACDSSREKVGQIFETSLEKSQDKEPKSASRKTSISNSLGKCGVDLGPVESNYRSASSDFPSVSNVNGMRSLQLQERYYQLQMLLMKLDQSDHEEYLQVLRSLSSVELSRHAVELEKRSIYLSLEEEKEMMRVDYLKILGKTP